MRNTIIISTIFLLVLTSCTPQQSQYHVGVSQCLDDAWRQKMNNEMQRELLLHPEMTLSTRVAYGNNELQCAQIDSFVSEAVDLLIVSPNVGDEVKPAVTRAYRAGIPVIIADRRVSGDEWTAFIGGDNYRVGQLMGQWVHGIQQESASPIHVLEVAGLPGSTPATLRHQGMMEHLSELGGTQPIFGQVMGEWFEDEAYEVVSAYLRTHKDIKVIVAHNDLMAIGAAHAVEDAKGYGKGSVRIMGVDGISVGLQAVDQGVIECTATYLSRGDMVIQTAAQILAGKPFVRDTILETTMVDASAARPLLTQYEARMHDIETLQMVKLQSDRKWEQMRAGKALTYVLFTIAVVFLIVAIAILIIRHRRLSKEIKRDIIPQLEEVQEAIQLNQRDRAFADQLKQIVEIHLTDPNLSVEFLSDKLHLSRTQLFRRVKNITGKGPLDYIREQRLNRADHLLRTTDLTVQQVALELCFSSPGYFSKCYKEQFGHLPSQRN